MASLAVDTPATIAVLGAGPVGLEAALYARFLGYDVNIYERKAVGETLSQAGHVRLFTPFGLNCSTLGLAALEAQSPQWRPPTDDAWQTAAEFVESYLVPLSQTDLLSGSLRLGVTVVAVGREGLLRHEWIGSPTRAQHPFVLLLRDENQEEQIAKADVVLDATGTFDYPNPLGNGGVPATGEQRHAAIIEHGLPDILGAARNDYGGKHTLVVGAGHSAGANVVALAELAADFPGTHITWITRRPAGDADAPPIALIENDRLPERDRIARLANELAQAGGVVRHVAGVAVEGVSGSDGALDVKLTGASDETLRVDRVLANTGFHADPKLNEALQVDTCYASGAGQAGRGLGAETSADGLDVGAAEPEALVHPEPNFYIIGAKSYGSDSRFFMLRGREQIRDVFSLIGGRANLDLYRGIRRSAESP